MRPDRTMNFERWRHYARGWLFHFAGNTEKAYQSYVAAFRQDPQDIQSARHLAFIATERKRYDAAEEWFLQALRIDPKDAATHFNLGYAREQAGRRREAIESFRDAVRLQPNLDRAWYGLGLALAGLGEHAQAVEAFAEAARLQPMNGEAYYQLGMARHHAGMRDATRETVEKLVAFDPKRARQLVRDSGREDLAALIPQLPF
ncbi:MAG: tetratricopeptide repeat protein [Rhodocyclaceae bacterium]|nr:tetratricopeptide repeat protein [Rhodocyclaceae bacterium]